MHGEAGALVPRAVHSMACRYVRTLDEICHRMLFEHGTCAPASPLGVSRELLRKEVKVTIKFAIITCSDTRTLETDEAGQKLEQLIAEQGWECIRRVVEMDERPFIAGALIDACDNTDADIVLTCGGSGLSLRDVTPEATRDVADREVPGIAEAMRAHSVAITPFAMLSRAICAQRGHTLIINLPGSTKAATENWEGIVEALPHAVKMMAGEGHSTQKDLSEKLAAAAARGELG